MKKAGKKFARTVFAFLLACMTMMAMTTTIFADGESLKDKGVLDYNQAYDYELEKKSDAVGASGNISSGWYSLGSKLSYMKFPAELVKNGAPDGVWCYCIDITTNTVDHHKYSITTLDAAEYYEDEVSDKIRAMLLNSYPHLSIAELEEKYGLTDLTEEEAFLATQWVVWYYSNPDGDVEYDEGVYYPADLYKPSEFSGSSTRIDVEDDDGNEISYRSTNVVKLAKALDALEPAEDYDTEPVVIKYEKRVYTDKVVLDMKDSVNFEDLREREFVVKNADGETVPYTLAGTRIIIEREHLDFEDNTAGIVLEVSGVQTLNEDVYFFAPEGGRDASQSRVAVCSGDVPVASFATFSLPKAGFDQVEDDAELKVTKNVQVNGQPYRSENVFYAALFEDKECTKFAEYGDVTAIEMDGEASASVIFHELVPGKTYYVAETDAEGNVLKDGDCGIETITYKNGEIAADTELLGEAEITNCYTEEENMNEDQGAGEGDKDKGDSDKKDNADKNGSNVKTGDDITHVIIAAVILMTAAVSAIALLAGRKRQS